MLNIPEQEIVQAKPLEKLNMTKIKQDQFLIVINKLLTFNQIYNGNNNKPKEYTI